MQPFSSHHRTQISAHDRRRIGGSTRVRIGGGRISNLGEKLPTRQSSRLDDNTITSVPNLSRDVPQARRTLRNVGPFRTYTQVEQISVSRQAKAEAKDKISSTLLTSPSLINLTQLLQNYPLAFAMPFFARQTLMQVSTTTTLLKTSLLSMNHTRMDQRNPSIMLITPMSLTPSMVQP